MIEILEPITKQCVVYAHIQSTEEIAFYGELADKYNALFKKAKSDILAMEISASLAFLAKHSFTAVSSDFFQRVDTITL